MRLPISLRSAGSVATSRCCSSTSASSAVRLPSDSRRSSARNESRSSGRAASAWRQASIACPGSCSCASRTRADAAHRRACRSGSPAWSAPFCSVCTSGPYSFADRASDSMSASVSAFDTSTSQARARRLERVVDARQLLLDARPPRAGSARVRCDPRPPSSWASSTAHQAGPVAGVAVDGLQHRGDAGAVLRRRPAGSPAPRWPPCARGCAPAPRRSDRRRRWGCRAAARTRSARRMATASRSALSAARASWPSR